MNKRSSIRQRQVHFWSAFLPEVQQCKLRDHHRDEPSAILKNQQTPCAFYFDACSTKKRIQQNGFPSIMPHLTALSLST